MQGTVEERMLSVRRSLSVDQTSAGTQICGSNQMDLEARETYASRIRTPEIGDHEFNDAEALFGCAEMKINQA